MISQVYCIKCSGNGKVYIGGSSRSGIERWRGHLSLLRKGKHKNLGLQGDFIKYGEGSFSLSILEDCADEDIARKEAEWCLRMKAYEDPHGYNVNSAPSGGRAFRKLSARTHPYFRRVEPEMVGILDGVLFGERADVKVGAFEDKVEIERLKFEIEGYREEIRRLKEEVNLERARKPIEHLTDKFERDGEVKRLRARIKELEAGL